MSLYKIVIGIVAFGLSFISGYLSVTGIGMLFGIQEWPIIVMAIFLEFGKVASASVIFKYKNNLPTWLKSLLVMFTIVIMIVSSLSIFGYLSSNYEDTRLALETDNTAIERTESQAERYENRLENLDQQRAEIQNNINQTRQRLQDAEAQLQERGWAIDRENVNSINEDLDRQQNRLQEINSKYEDARQDLLDSENRLEELQVENKDVKNALGPLLFVSRTLNVDTDSAVLTFILILIFVFDPMAITLVIVITESSSIENNKDNKTSSVEKKSAIPFQFKRREEQKKSNKSNKAPEDNSDTENGSSDAPNFKIGTPVNVKKSSSKNKVKKHDYNRPISVSGKKKKSNNEPVTFQNKNKDLEDKYYVHDGGQITKLN